MSPEPITSRRPLLLFGRACLAAGVVGAAAAVLLVVVDPAVSEDRYSYPLTPGGFAALQVFFFLHHFGLLAGLYGLLRSGATGGSRFGAWGAWGAWGAVAGMVLLTVTELAAATAANFPYPSARTDVLDALYGISSISIGLGLISVGVAVVRHKRWLNWYRFIPLILGVYVFIPMTPALFGPYALARFAIGGWMLGFALLGWALIETGGAPTPGSTTRETAPVRVFS